MASQEQPTTIDILGPGTLAEDVLAHLLEDRGYDTRIIQEALPSLADVMLDGVDVLEDMLNEVDVLLLSTGLCNGVRDAFLSIVRGNPKTAAMPVLTLSTATKQLLDDRSVPVAWPSPLENLKRAIEAALTPATSGEG